MNNIENKVLELIEKMPYKNLKKEPHSKIGSVVYYIGDRIRLEAEYRFSALNINTNDEVDMGYEKYNLVIDSHYFDVTKEFFDTVQKLHSYSGYKYSDVQKEAMETIQDEIDKVSTPSMKM